ncbi:hypothetical protein PR048_016877 [Dryococelus australis]|uniref:DUF5641 domain-containing protein n=1 Tax=Dryococelus australis TaxID=614101 RepID=A0ABQ9H7Z3_9NEOP|nr:hypothetical protein PR048_016877 [Dryococelus australis]
MIEVCGECAFNHSAVFINLCLVLVTALILQSLVHSRGVSSDVVVGMAKKAVCDMAFRLTLCTSIRRYLRAKGHLKRVVGDQALTFEQYATHLVCAIGNGVKFYAVLPVKILSLLQSIVLVECSSWEVIKTTEYLNTLQQRLKWSRNFPNVKEGHLVVVKDDNLPPLNSTPQEEWLSLRLTVHTKTSSLKSPVVELCPLPSQRCEEKKEVRVGLE